MCSAFLVTMVGWDIKFGHKGEKMLEEKLIETKLLCKGSFLEIYQDKVCLPNEAYAMRDVIRHPGAVAILAINDQNEVLLVQQYRHAVGTLLWEIPAGKIDQGEEPLKAAYREFSEETPYTVKHLELLQSILPAPGFCDEVIHIYRGQGIQENSQLTPDEDEFIHVQWLSVDTVKQWISEGKIQDAKTLIAVLMCI